MPVKLVTPSRALIIFLTAIFVTAANLILKGPIAMTNDQYEDTIIQRSLSGPLAQDEPILLEWIKKQFVPPSSKAYNLKYDFSGLDEDQTDGEHKSAFSPSQEFILDKVEELASQWADKHLKGIFLEAGAYDGEFLSNTLVLEKIFGWQGILVEAHPSFYSSLIKKNRKAWSINACLNTKPFASKELFAEASDKANTGQTLDGPPIPRINLHVNLASSGLDDVIQLKNKSQIATRFEVQCFPIYSIVKSLGISHIDFLSLDVERAEMGILATIPWDKLTFTMMAIEHPTLEDLRDYLFPRGYVHLESNLNDHIFVKKDLALIFNRATSQNKTANKNDAPLREKIRKQVDNSVADDKFELSWPDKTAPLPTNKFHRRSLSKVK